MSRSQTVHFYLEEPLRKSAAAGEHNFINLVSDVLRAADLTPVFAPLPLQGDPTPGLSLSHMVQPPNDNGLVFRRAYHYPFWQIETVAQRWQWDVARARFDPQDSGHDARRFYRYWQKRLFGDAAAKTSRDGFTYVPLQGHLQRKRLFQSCTPLEMIGFCLDHAPQRRIIAALHPNENYSDSDLTAITALAVRHSRLSVVTGEMEKHLARCDYVVTQNSGVAFSGLFFGKPALLFGQIDFHHICIKADMDALGDSFAQVARHAPPYAEFIWWFWQQQAINAGRSDAKAKIARRLRRFGWPIRG